MISIYLNINANRKEKKILLDKQEDAVLNQKLKNSVNQLREEYASKKASMIKQKVNAKEAEVMDYKVIDLEVATVKAATDTYSEELEMEQEEEAKEEEENNKLLLEVEAENNKRDCLIRKLTRKSLESNIYEPLEEFKKKCTKKTQLKH